MPHTAIIAILVVTDDWAYLANGTATERYTGYFARSGALQNECTIIPTAAINSQQGRGGQTEVDPHSKHHLRE